MNLPNSIPQFLKCPNCMPFDTWDKKLSRLEWQKDQFGYFYLVYYCDNCRNGFTTTESDTISLKNRQNKKRSELRKIKINKINVL